MNRQSKPTKILLSVILFYFVVRAIVEIFMVHPGKPETYHNDWGGPTYIGVMLVHCLPGIVAAYILWRLWRKHPNA